MLACCRVNMLSISNEIYIRIGKTTMYRCYLIRDSRIALADDFNVATLEMATVLGRELLAAQPKKANFSGIEVWKGAVLLHSDAQHAHASASSAPIISPFDTGESTIFSTWRPSRARSLLCAAFTVGGETSLAVKATPCAAARDEPGRTLVAACGKTCVEDIRSCTHA
jgi:hypothetical protein